MIGTVLAHYRIESRLGAGGMGVVYRAFDEQLRRHVALKVLPESLRDDPEARARLLREARATASLSHPNICTVFGVGEDRGWSFIAMEQIEGRMLRDSIPEGGLPVASLLRLGAQIADAVGFAHARRLLHRDLKSTNVMVTPTGQAKVLDFGLSMYSAEGAGGETTLSTALGSDSGSLSGTPQYLAPELLRGEAPSARTDVWSLGVLLYEMATGSLPFRGRTVAELGAAILHDSPEPLPERVSPGLAGIIRRCLEKQPEHRYRTADEIRAALETVADGVQATLPRGGPIPPDTEPSPAIRGQMSRAAHRARIPGGARVFLAAAAIVVAAMAVGAWVRSLVVESRTGVVLNVRDEEGRPVAGVRVVRAEDGRGLGLTGDDGRVSLRIGSKDEGTHLRLTDIVEGRDLAFDPHYPVLGDELKSGMMFVRVQSTATAEAAAILRITSEPAGADVYVNGEMRARTDTTIRGNPGPAEVVVMMAGFLPDTVLRFLEPGENPELHRILVPMPRQERGLPTFPPKSQRT